MKTLINTISRAIALYQVRCLEIQLHDQTNALQVVSDVETFREICSAREITQRELLAARRHYIGTLQPGHCPTWKTA